MAKSPYDPLVRDGVLTREALAAATRSASDKRMSVGWILVNEHKLPLETVGKALSSHYRVPFVAYRDDLKPLPDFLELLNRELCTSYRAVPIDREKNRLVLLMADPGDLPNKDQLEGHLRQPFNVRVALPEHIHRLLHGAEPEPWSPPPLPIDPPTMAPEEEMSGMAELGVVEESPIVALVNMMLVKCLQEKGEEIRLDPRQTPAAAWRVGAEWRDLQIPPNFHQNIVRRFKVMANLDIGSRAKEQQGFFQLQYFQSRRRFDVAIEPIGGGDEAARVTPATA